ncbi:hypothetical protein BaRGS_00030659 [Batillaria attramentaria]|uniref:Uncharacterized protein n=1 Tax=Batillaria attramentaria TaxID=370345 RepID=A0ABD0JTV2_9CAEN
MAKTEVQTHTAPVLDHAGQVENCAIDADYEELKCRNKIAVGDLRHRERVFAWGYISVAILKRARFPPHTIYLSAERKPPHLGSFHTDKKERTPVPVEESDS